MSRAVGITKQNRTGDGLRGAGQGECAGAEFDRAGAGAADRAPERAAASEVKRAGKGHDGAGVCERHRNQRNAGTVGGSSSISRSPALINEF